MNTRFAAKKRTAIDGKTWWCIWDSERRTWSTYTCHGQYRTKKAALIGIEVSSKYFK